MKKNKILLLVDSLNVVDRLKKESNVTFLFPITGYSVGFRNSFQIDEIPEGFIFVNRILDNQGIDEFRSFIKVLPSKIKGIVFDDIGVMNVLLKENISITKILFLNHFNCNYDSINAYLELVDSVVVSPDITLGEIDLILKKAVKPLTLFTFGHVNIMYSRRRLISNYNKHFNLDVEKEVQLEERMAHKQFKMIEQEYGTVIYTDLPFNGLVLRDRDNVLYNFFNTIFLEEEEIVKIVESDDNLEEVYPYKYLSEKETVFKISDVKE